MSFDPTLPNADTNFARHWATLLSPSPSPEISTPKSINNSMKSAPNAAGPSGISLPPLHTAVPLARLDTYRRKDMSVSPIQEMLFRKSPLSAHSYRALPSPSVERRQADPVASSSPMSAGCTGIPYLKTDLGPHISTFDHSKSPRKRADQGQLDVLNRAFSRSPYPSTEERDRLSKKLGMTSRSVQIWFQNKRRSIKVQEESIQERLPGPVY